MRKICSDIAEANHALQSVIISNARNGYRNISLPWLLTEQQKQCYKRGHLGNKVSNEVFVEHSKYINGKR